MPKKISAYRKRLGQVFLRDPLAIEKILQHAQLATDETILEIGPGGGALTRAIASRGNTLFALEIDAHYVQTLQQHFASIPHVHIIQADARHYNYTQLPNPLVVLANLPYSTGTHILRHLFTYRDRLSRLIIMLQKEVAERLLAKPGTHAYSGLSIFFQYHAAVHKCFDVSRHAFTPRPEVDSTVLQLEPFSTSPWPSSNPQFLFTLIKCAFAHRRKTLRKNLLAVPDWHLNAADVESVLNHLDLHQMIRPQELDVSQFVALAKALQPLLPCQNLTGRRESEQ
jgi:16S rRNA (adenine1518-N6/adenine1519-N6)-dimethyltransferase